MHPECPFSLEHSFCPPYLAFPFKDVTIISKTLTASSVLCTILHFQTPSTQALSAGRATGPVTHSRVASHPLCASVCNGFVSLSLSGYHFSELLPNTRNTDGRCNIPHCIEVSGLWLRVGGCPPSPTANLGAHCECANKSLLPLPLNWPVHKEDHPPTRLHNESKVFFIF